MNDFNQQEYKTRPKTWIEEIERELSMRKKVYPRLIGTKQLTRKKATKQWYALTDILRYLNKQFPEAKKTIPKPGNIFNQL